MLIPSEIAEGPVARSVGTACQTSEMMEISARPDTKVDLSRKVTYWGVSVLAVDLPQSEIVLCQRRPEPPVLSVGAKIPLLLLAEAHPKQSGVLGNRVRLSKLGEPERSD